MNKIIQKKLFSQDECDYFKSLSDNKIFKRSEITEHTNLNIISECRTSLEVDVQIDSDLSNLILEKLKEFGIKSLPNYFIILKYDKSGYNPVWFITFYYDSLNWYMFATNKIK